MIDREASTAGHEDVDEAGRAGPVHLSVVIAAYDAATTLGAQLDALSAQDPPFRWEIVVADNGSCDGTADLVRERSRELPNLRLVDASARRGAAAARNIGAAHAGGRSLAFCDADDVVAPGWVDSIGAALEENAFVAGRLEWTLLNDEATRASRWHDTTDHLDASPHEPRLLRGGGGNMGVRTELFRAIGGFCEEAPTLEDIDLCWRVQLAGEPLVFVPDAVVHYRLRSGARELARQAFRFGQGERWLDLRYREVRRAAAARSATTSAEHSLRRTRIGRVVSRLTETSRTAARVRNPGELARWSWDVCFGLGYSRGLAVEPDPVFIEDLGDGPVPVDLPALAVWDGPVPVVGLDDAEVGAAPAPMADEAAS